VRNRVTEPLQVEDLLVVAIGDSYASGEGNPEQPGADPRWADGGGDPAVEAAHAAARRSTVGWPARVALALEREDSLSSVTFVSVAASGASIERGVLGPQPDVAERSQIDQVVRLVGDRPIDVLLVSVGGNDIGFSRIVEALVDADPLFDPICYGTDLDNTWASAVDGDWTRTSGLAPGLPFGLECRTEYSGDRNPVAGLAGLPGEYDRLAAAIGRLEPGRVVITEYPDPTGGADATCREIVGDAFGAFRFLEISRSEQEEGRRRVIEPLNAAVREAAERHGWAHAAGIADRFADGHGYCGDWPDYRPAGGSGGPDRDRTEEWYRNPGAEAVLPAVDDSPTSWYRTAEQSVILQGPDLPYRTTGTMHPNELGHAVIAGAVLAALAGTGG
jgi:lysophospholipase L1-like esterase